MTMDELPYISNVLFTHRKGVTILGCNTYMSMSSIQAIDHQSYVARFCRIFKPRSHSQGGVGDVSVAMDCSPPFSHVFLVHGKGWTSLEINPYTGMPSIQITDLPRCEPRSGRICKPPRHPHGGMGCDTRYKWPCMGCHPFHMSC